MRTYETSLLCASSIALLMGCSDESTSNTTDGGVTSDLSGVTLSDCAALTAHVDKAVCAANNLLAVLPAAQKSSVNLAYTASTDRTKWSNLPNQARPGLKMSQLDATSQAAVLTLMSTVLSNAGYSDLVGIRAADDYLNAQGANGYGGGNYLIAIVGTPSATGNWEVMFGGHHMAFNVNYIAGVGYPTPNHQGTEPKGSFTVNSRTYQPLDDEGAAMLAIFNSLGANLNSAYLSGQNFADVVVGPVEYGTGSSAAAKAKFPTGANRKGILGSTLSAAQQALVTTAIQGWVNDYDPAVSGALLSAYTSTEAYADTYVAWGGTQASGVNLDVNGTYLRIDGPRAWIEVSCQGGVVIQGKTHYHTIFRDKQYDYGGTL